MSFLILTRGPGEPEGFPLIRQRYYERHQARNRLEVRITRTLGGLAFVMRVRSL